jgi:Zn-dependent protease
MKFSWRRFLIALAAVVIGNAIYLLLMPFLPAKAKHAPFRPDWGLVLDFWICLVIFNLLLLFFRKPK